MARRKSLSVTPKKDKIRKFVDKTPTKKVDLSQYGLISLEEQNREYENNKKGLDINGNPIKRRGAKPGPRTKWSRNISGVEVLLTRPEGCKPDDPWKVFFNGKKIGSVTQENHKIEITQLKASFNKDVFVVRTEGGGIFVGEQRQEALESAVNNHESKD